MTTRVVVVGAGLAGASAAAELRKQGYEGELHMVGGEVHPPYTRPPLSKKSLTDEPRDLALPVARRLDADLHLGSPADHLDLSARYVELASGVKLPFDGLVVASGSSPTRVDVERFPDVLYLRTQEDGAALRFALRRASDLPVVIVGAGLIGCEVASAARALGREVVLVDIIEPCTRALGGLVGTYVRRLHERHGIRVLVGVGVDQVELSDVGSSVHLDDGSVVEAGDVLVAIGSRPETAWLEGAGLELSDGVVCNAAMVTGPGVVAAGDVARWRLNGASETVRLENWNNAAEQGRHAARSLLAELHGSDPEPFVPVPWYWTEQHGVRLQVAGWLDTGAAPSIQEGSLDDDSFVAVDPDHRYVVAANRPREFNDWLAEAQARTTAGV